MKAGDLQKFGRARAGGGGRRWPGAVKDEGPLGGWLSPPRPTYSRRQRRRSSPSQVVRIDSQEGWSWPARGERGAGGPGGPEAGTSAILAGEGTTLHRVPSLPPARGPGSRSAPPAAGPAPEPGSRRGSWVQLEAGDLAPGRGGRGRRGGRWPEGRPRWPGKPLSDTQRCARLLFKYSERAARSRRHGDACPSNATEWLLPGNARAKFWGRPLRCSRFLPRAGGGLRRPSEPRAPLQAAPPSPPPGRPPAPKPRGVLNAPCPVCTRRDREPLPRRTQLGGTGLRRGPNPTTHVRCAPNVSALRTSPPSTPPHIQSPGRHHVPTHPQLPSAPRDSSGPPNPTPSPHLAAAQVRQCPGRSPSHIPPSSPTHLRARGTNLPPPPPPPRAPGSPQRRQPLRRPSGASPRSASEPLTARGGSAPPKPPPAALGRAAPPHPPPATRASQCSRAAARLPGAARGRESPARGRAEEQERPRGPSSGTFFPRPSSGQARAESPAGEGTVGFGALRAERDRERRFREVARGGVRDGHPVHPPSRLPAPPHSARPGFKGRRENGERGERRSGWGKEETVWRANMARGL
ncbi:basic proline-rich protein-like [Meles meles]|uniref:basic proline-rich protein-like n=1 Tax=Meles meles TaxID=9662 RepID=UPI001E69F088|nr:basic proline-rich protein-like [Meles meles]